MTVRAGLGASVLSWLLVAATAAYVAITATEQPRVVATLMVAAFVTHAVVIFVGSPRLVISSSVFVLAAVTVEALGSDEPLWIRSIIVGLLWYVAMEVSWHALERRDGTIFTRAAVAHRVQEVAGVVALTLALGLVAIVLATAAPGRSVALQAMVLGGVLAAVAALARQLAPDDESNPSIT